MMKQKSFGLDLAGYSSGGSALAIAEIETDDQVCITLNHSTVFAKSVRGFESIVDVNRAEVVAIQKMFAAGVVVVDACLDLQGLPNPPSPSRVWQLTQRSVDRSFGGLPPLSHLIGACAARMQHLLTSCAGRELLGKRLFETYPAASLKLLGLHFTKYKGRATFVGGKWFGMQSEKAGEMKMNSRLAENLNNLGWLASDGFLLNHDDFDAALCALTGIASASHRLEASDLRKEIARRLIEKGDLSQAEVADTHLPLGYMLLNKKFGRIQLRDNLEELF